MAGNELELRKKSRLAIVERFDGVGAVLDDCSKMYLHSWFEIHHLVVHDLEESTASSWSNSSLKASSRVGWMHASSKASDKCDCDHRPIRRLPVTAYQPSLSTVRVETVDCRMPVQVVPD